MTMAKKAIEFSGADAGDVPDMDGVEMEGGTPARWVEGELSAGADGLLDVMARPADSLGVLALELADKMFLPFADSLAGRLSQRMIGAVFLEWALRYAPVVAEDYRRCMGLLMASNPEADPEDLKYKVGLQLHIAPAESGVGAVLVSKVGTAGVRTPTRNAVMVQLDLF
jgi:hypothetical protein